MPQRQRPRLKRTLITCDWCGSTALKLYPSRGERPAAALALSLLQLDVSTRTLGGAAESRVGCRAIPMPSVRRYYHPSAGPRPAAGLLLSRVQAEGGPGAVTAESCRRGGGGAAEIPGGMAPGGEGRGGVGGVRRAWRDSRRGLPPGYACHQYRRSPPRGEDRGHRTHSQSDQRPRWSAVCGRAVQVSCCRWEVAGVVEMVAGGPGAALELLRRSPCRGPGGHGGAAQARESRRTSGRNGEATPGRGTRPRRRLYGVRWVLPCGPRAEARVKTLLFSGQNLQGFPCLKLPLFSASLFSEYILRVRRSFHLYPAFQSLLTACAVCTSQVRYWYPPMRTQTRCA